MKICYPFILIFLSVISAYPQTRFIQVNPGWNLLSLPLTTPDSFKSVIFPSAVSSAFIYQNGYQAQDTILNGAGFWLKFDSAETIYIVGNKIYDDTIEVRAGWNLIGSISTPVPADSIKSDPPDLIISDYFNFTGGTYHATDTLEPGFGTWVKTKQDGLIILSGDTIPVTGVPCPGMPTVEYAGKIYNTVQIGSQCWLKQNLDIGVMMAGTDTLKDNDIIEKYCYNDSIENCNKYGGLYRWDEAMGYSTTQGAKGICPDNWHMPTIAEFQTLGTAVLGDGNALKAIGQGIGPGAGTNTSGFSVLFSGFRYGSGIFSELGYMAYFWSSSEYTTSLAISFFLNFHDSIIYLNYGPGKIIGFSVRCVKD